MEKRRCRCCSFAPRQVSDGLSADGKVKGRNGRLAGSPRPEHNLNRACLANRSAGCPPGLRHKKSCLACVIRAFRSMQFNRRMLWLGAGLSAGKLWSRATGGESTPALFQEIPPSSSGIEWVHENAMSPSVPAGNPGSGLRIPRLRQRRLDGHLPGE